MRRNAKSEESSTQKALLTASLPWSISPNGRQPRLQMLVRVGACKQQVSVQYGT